MGDHDNGGAFPVEVHQELENFVGGFSVQVAGGFVRQDGLGFVQKCPGNGNALLLAAGELVRHLVGLGTHAHGFQHFPDAFVDTVPLLPAGGAEHELQIGLYAAVREQLKILENHAQGTPEIGDVPFFQGAQVVAAGLTLALEELVFRRNGADDGGFAGAHFAHNVHKVSGPDVHVQVVQHHRFSVQDIGVFKMNERFHVNNSKIIQI